METIPGQLLTLSVDTWGRFRIFSTEWKYLKSMIHGMSQQGGEITENADTINRDDVWPRAGNQGEIRTPRMAIDAAGTETEYGG
jgi:hypothetical protein